MGEVAWDLPQNPEPLIEAYTDGSAYLPAHQDVALSGAALWTSIPHATELLRDFAEPVAMEEGYASVAKGPGGIHSSTRAEVCGGFLALAAKAATTNNYTDSNGIRSIP